LTFSRRLILFFLLIVVVPMIALAVLVIELTGESETGKADARLAESLATAIAIYEQDVADARTAGKAIATDPQLAAALESPDQGGLDAVAARLADEHDVAALEISDQGRQELAAVDFADPFALTELELQGQDGGALGMLRVSTTTSSDYLIEIDELTGEDAALVDSSGEPFAGTVPVQDAELPASGESADLEVEGEDVRAATAELPNSQGTRVALFAPVESGGFLGSSPGVAAALAAFFAIALAFVVLLTRALSGQVSEMLAAARRIGEGDFSRPLPVHGKDEMAGLASEFNKMSERLSDQMDELRLQRMEIERSVKRIGEAFASGLDREALLEIVVETTVGACSAEYGLIALSGRVGAEAEVGSASEAVQEAALAAEEQALRNREVVEMSSDSAHAMSGPLSHLGRPSDALGAMTVARAGAKFTPDEHDVFRYLVGQASASVENVALHEIVSQQAVTDELTGLANNRGFRDWIEREAARAERFGHDLSLVILDIDDFKQVNDTHGHLQGDAVLRAIGRILRMEARAVDQAARYGGEEFVLGLPETDSVGAVELADRVRSRVESTRVALLHGGSELTLTASLGVATMPAAAADVEALIAATDAALYQAKRAGKNQVQVAPDRHAARPDQEARTPAV
jgi:diguanylate cyclase (GGDEF)-like protein